MGEAVEGAAAGFGPNEKVSGGLGLLPSAILLKLKREGPADGLAAGLKVKVDVGAATVGGVESYKEDNRGYDAFVRTTNKEPWLRHGTTVGSLTS